MLLPDPATREFFSCLLECQIMNDVSDSVLIKIVLNRSELNLLSRYCLELDKYSGTNMLMNSVSTRPTKKSSSTSGNLSFRARNRHGLCSMAAIEYVDRPGEIRAARVPEKRKQMYFNNLGEVLAHAGIKPLSTNVAE